MKKYFFTQGEWSIGKSGRCIISTKDNGLDLNGATRESATKYYGGNLIYEGVSDNNANLLSVAKDMFYVLDDLENDNNQIPEWLWEARNKALNKAKGYILIQDEVKRNFCQYRRNLRYDRELTKINNRWKCIWCIKASRTAHESS